MNVNAKIEKRQLFVDHLLRGDITTESRGNDLAAMLGVSSSVAIKWRNFFFGYKTQAERSYENFVRRLENDLPLSENRDDARRRTENRLKRERPALYQKYLTYTRAARRRARKEKLIEEIAEYYRTTDASNEDAMKKFKCGCAMAAEARVLVYDEPDDGSEPPGIAKWDERYEREVNGYGMRLQKKGWKIYRKLWEERRNRQEETIGITAERMYGKKNAPLLKVSGRISERLRILTARLSQTTKTNKNTKITNLRSALSTRTCGR